MRLGTLVAALLVLTCALTEVTCMTNKEFFELVKDYAEDIEEFEVDDPAIKDDDDEDTDVIDLPGGPDDELDLEYLVSKLDLADKIQNLQEAEKSPAEEDHGVSWWRRRRRRRRRRRWHNPCRCHRYACTCSLTHTFRVNLYFKKYRFRVRVSVTVAYLPRNYGFSFTISFNGRRVYHREISVRHPPALCFGVPGFTRFVRACIRIYNVDIRARRMCLKVYAVVNVVVKKVKFGIKLGCFRIPLLDENPDILKLLQHVDTSIEDTETGEVQEVALSDLPNLYRQLQIEAGERKDLDAETGNDESDSLVFLPEEKNDLEVETGSKESDGLMVETEE